MAVVAGPAAAVEAVGAAVAMVVAGIGERQMCKPQETCRCPLVSNERGGAGQRWAQR